MTEEERKEKGIESLPGSLEAAVKCMKENELVKNVLGNHTFNQYIKAKEFEWDNYRTMVHQWEIDNYLKIY